MEPEVLEHVEPGRSSTGPGTSFPSCWPTGHPLYGCVADGYWEDVGTAELPAGPGRRARGPGQRRHRRVRDCPRGSGSPRAPRSTPRPSLIGPLYIGRLRQGRGRRGAARVHRDRQQRRRQGRRVPAPLRRARQRLHRPAGRPARRASSASAPTSCARSRSTKASIVGDDCVVEEEAVLGDGVRVYPSKMIEAGTSSRTSVIWESRGQRDAVRAARGLRHRQRRDHA